jgi:hypothetical protein
MKELRQNERERERERDEREKREGAFTFLQSYYLQSYYSYYLQSYYLDSDQSADKTQRRNKSVEEHLSCLTVDR